MKRLFITLALALPLVVACASPAQAQDDVLPLHNVVKAVNLFIERVFLLVMLYVCRNPTSARFNFFYAQTISPHTTDYNGSLKAIRIHTFPIRIDDPKIEKLWRYLYLTLYSYYNSNI